MACYMLLIMEQLHAQSVVHQYEQEYSYYFEKNNTGHRFLFDLDSTCSASFFKYYITLAGNISSHDSLYHLHLQLIHPHSDCQLTYRQFLLKDSIYASIDHINIDIKSGMNVLTSLVINKYNIQHPYYEYDTLFVWNNITSTPYIKVTDIKFGYSQQARMALIHYRNRIDDYYKCDSVFASLHTQLDQTDTSYVDRYPVYLFKIQSVEHSLNQIRQQHFERMLQASALDTMPYYSAYNTLKHRIEYLKQLLQQKLTHIDELFYNKALNCEQAGDIKNAVYYYHRVLDYNPEHCNSIYRLSSLYTRNREWNKNYELWHKIAARGDSLPCKQALLLELYDSLYSQINKHIAARNYYDALKIIDTADMFARIVPVESCYNYLPRIKSKAQEGIYVSYYEIIGKAIRINKLNLAHTYAAGLTQLMYLYNDSIQNHTDFKNLALNIAERHKENIRKNISYKRYTEALNEINATLLFTADTLHLIIDSDFFAHEYTDIYTYYYNQKLEQVQQAARSGNLLLTGTLSNEADQYFAMHSSYIQLTSRNTTPSQRPAHPSADSVYISDNYTYDITTDIIAETPKDTIAIQKHINELCFSIHLYDIPYGNYSLLDSFLLLKQLQTDINAVNDIKNVYLTEKKLTPTIQYAFMKYNQWVYCNDFEPAKQLYNRIERAYDLYGLDTIASLHGKKDEALLLMDQRMQMYLEEEFQLTEIKSREYLRQQQYYEAYQLLHQKQRELQNQNLYSQNIYRITEKIRPAAEYQSQLQQIEVYLNLHLWDTAFTAYTSLQDYYTKENIQQYHLICPGLPDFLNTPSHQKYLPHAALWYMQQQDYTHCMEIYNIMKNRNMLSEKGQNKLAEMFLKNSQNFDWLAQYPFGKEDKIFLRRLVSSKIYRYIIHK